jgi:hypothetical protein
MTAVAGCEDTHFARTLYICKTWQLLSHTSASHPPVMLQRLHGRAAVARINPVRTWGSIFPLLLQRATFGAGCTQASNPVSLVHFGALSESE